MNKVILSGNLTADVELKTYGKGKDKGSLCNFTLGVRRDKDNSDFIRCTAFNKTAEFLEEYTSKGSKILIEGSIQVTSEKDEKGNYKNYTNIIVNNIELLTSKEKEDDGIKGKKKNSKKSKSKDNDFDYSEMSKRELKELCDERDIEYSKKDTEEDLIELLEEWDNE